MSSWSIWKKGVPIAVVFSAVSIGIACAQTIPSGIQGITLTQSTNNPTPGQAMTITAASYTFDINSATITWSVSGKQVQKGVGLTTLNVSAPALGKKTTVDIKAVTPSGASYSNSLVLGSGSIDMIFEADGYTPPSFLGKFPLVFQNNATVIAVPHLADSSGHEYDPATLVYQWRKDDGTVLQSQSGYGKESITMAGTIIPRPYYLIVTASSRDGTAQAESLIQIAAQSPSIVFYRDDPLYGPLYNIAIGNNLYIGAQKEVTALAALFGFNNGLSLDWLINSTSHPELALSQSVVLRAPDGISGTSRVSLDVRGANNILQQADGGFTATFTAGKQAASSTSVTF